MTIISRCCKAEVFRDGTRGDCCNKCRMLCRTVEVDGPTPSGVIQNVPTAMPTPTSTDSCGYPCSLVSAFSQQGG